MPKKKPEQNKVHGQKRIIILLFCVIIVIASIIRLYKLSSIPPGVNRDEASIGYTAYSLIETGKDEYGRAYPLSFESFGDWKLPLYIYETVPFVKLLGLNEIAIRLPSAIAGILAVALTYALVFEFTSNPALSLLSMAFLSIAPWHVHLSRVESESNTAVLFVIIGSLTALKALKRKHFFLLVSAVSFSLSLFIYHGNHVFTMLFVGSLILVYINQLKKSKYSLHALTIFTIISGVIFSATLFGADKTKISGISIFGSPGIIHEFIEIPRNEHINPQSLIARISHNRMTFALERVIHNYINAFSPQFLFISGGTNYAHNIANMGNLYLIDAIFLPLGLIVLLSGKYRSILQASFTWREAALILVWFFISPIAASITKDAPHTNRMAAIIPSHIIIITIGIYWLIHRIGSFYKKLVPLASIIILCMYLWNVSLYVDRYFVHFPRDEAEHWGYGYDQLLNELNSPAQRGKTVIMSHPEYSPYIYFLFYSSFSPSDYQNIAKRYPPTEDAFVHVASYDRFQFRPIDWDKDPKTTNIVIVELTKDLPPEAKTFKVRKDIMLPDGSSMWTVLTN